MAKWSTKSGTDLSIVAEGHVLPDRQDCTGGQRLLDVHSRRVNLFPHHPCVNGAKPARSRRARSHRGMRFKIERSGGSLCQVRLASMNRGLLIKGTKAWSQVIQTSFAEYASRHRQVTWSKNVNIWFTDRPHSLSGTALIAPRR